LAGHAAYTSEMKYRQKISVPKRDGTDLEDLLVGVRSDNSIKMDINPLPANVEKMVSSE
jgi:hypothetical protein